MGATAMSVALPGLWVSVSATMPQSRASISLDAGPHVDRTPQGGS